MSGVGVKRRRRRAPRRRRKSMPLLSLSRSECRVTPPDFLRRHDGDVEGTLGRDPPRAAAHQLRHRLEEQHAVPASLLHTWRERGRLKRVRVGRGLPSSATTLAKASRTRTLTTGKKVSRGSAAKSDSVISSRPTFALAPGGASGLNVCAGAVLDRSPKTTRDMAETAICGAGSRQQWQRTATRSGPGGLAVA